MFLKTSKGCFLRFFLLNYKVIKKLEKMPQIISNSLNEFYKINSFFNWYYFLIPWEDKYF